MNKRIIMLGLFLFVLKIQSNIAHADIAASCLQPMLGNCEAGRETCYAMCNRYGDDEAEEGCQAACDAGFSNVSNSGDCGSKVNDLVSNVGQQIPVTKSNDISGRGRAIKSKLHNK